MPVLPSIVFVPGLLCDEALWQFQAEYLAGRYDLVMADTKQDDSIRAMADRILAAAPAKFALCALSMGGYVAMEIMRTAPERVTHLVLADTTARQDSPETRERRLGLIELAHRGAFKGVTPRLLPQLLAPASLEKAELRDIVMEMGERIGRGVYFQQQTAIMGRIDSRPSLTNISCPTAVIVGALDKLTPVENAEEMAALIPGAQLHIVPRAGHLTPLETPGRVNDIIGDLLTR